MICLLMLVLAGPAGAGVAERAVFPHDGQGRIHYAYVPPDAGPQTPLVIALHGMGGNARNLRYGIGLTKRLEAAGAAVVYPQGLRLPQGSRHWNAGFNYMDVDDVGYLTALATSLIQEHGLSPNVMVFGISMGGYMAYHMACHSSLQITAIVVVAGSMHPSDWGNCTPAQQVSLMHVHGRRDPVIPFAGGRHWSVPGRTLGVPQIAGAWAVAAGARPAAGVVTSPRVLETRYLSAETGGEVQLLELPDFGHDWPSRSTAGYDAIDDIVRFLARHSVP